MNEWRKSLDEALLTIEQIKKKNDFIILTDSCLEMSETWGKLFKTFSTTVYMCVLFMPEDWIPIFT